MTKPSFGKFSAEEIEEFITKMPSRHDKLNDAVKSVTENFKSLSMMLKKEHVLFGTRQDLVSYKSEIGNMSRQIGGEKKTILHTFLTQQVSASYKPKNASERDIIKNNRFKDIDYSLDILDAEMEWCNDSIKTCDNITNGISYAIKIINIIGYTPTR